MNSSLMFARKGSRGSVHLCRDAFTQSCWGLNIIFHMSRIQQSSNFLVILTTRATTLLLRALVDSLELTKQPGWVILLYSFQVCVIFNRKNLISSCLLLRCVAMIAVCSGFSVREPRCWLSHLSVEVYATALVTCQLLCLMIG